MTSSLMRATLKCDFIHGHLLSVPSWEQFLCDAGNERPPLVVCRHQLGDAADGAVPDNGRGPAAAGCGEFKATVRCWPRPEAITC